MYMERLTPINIDIDATIVQSHVVSLHTYIHIV